MVVPDSLLALRYGVDPSRILDRFNMMDRCQRDKPIELVITLVDADEEFIAFHQRALYRLGIHGVRFAKGHLHEMSGKFF